MCGGESTAALHPGAAPAEPATPVVVMNTHTHTHTGERREVRRDHGITLQLHTCSTKEGVHVHTLYRVVQTS